MNLYTPLDLVNQSLRNLGEQPITTFPDATNPRAMLAGQFWQQIRDNLFTDHFWNFATVRATLQPYTTPSAGLVPAAAAGTGVLFTASASGVFGLDAVGQGLQGVDVPGQATVTALVANVPSTSVTPGASALLPGSLSVPFTTPASVFVAGDVGALLERLDAQGLARITAIGGPTQAFGTIILGFVPTTTITTGQWRLVATNRVLADITTAWSGAPVPAGSWRLTEAAPAWGYRYRFRLPADYHSMQRTRDSVEYQREGDFFVSDEPTLSLTYTAQQNDVTRWPAYFVHALVAALTAAFAEQITGQQAKHQLWLQLAEARLKRAKMHDGQEGSAPQVISSTLIRARYGGWRGAGWR